MNNETDKCRLLRESMSDGYAYHKIVNDRNGNPADYVFLDVNPAFEAITGLEADEILGKTASEVLTGIKAFDFDWIGTYGQVAMTGKPVRFESYAGPLDRWYEVSAYSSEQGYFVAVFRDITERERSDLFQSLFGEVAENILSHHERWDGTGYPQGLNKKEIPLLARITAIADAYEVMSAGRVYQKALSESEVTAELKRCAGSQFDPELIETFLQLLMP